MTASIIVINVDIRETRVALVEQGVIAELQIERASHRGTVGNIVLGKVTRVLPGMQAAFIDVGQERSAFLHVEDLIRPDDFEKYLAGGADETDQSFRGTGERKATQLEARDDDDDDDDDDDAPVAAERNGAHVDDDADELPPGVSLSDGLVESDEDDEDDEDDDDDADASAEAEDRGAVSLDEAGADEDAAGADADELDEDDDDADSDSLDDDDEAEPVAAAPAFTVSGAVLTVEGGLADGGPVVTAATIEARGSASLEPRPLGDGGAPRTRERLDSGGPAPGLGEARRADAEGRSERADGGDSGRGRRQRGRHGSRGRRGRQRSNGQGNQKLVRGGRRAAPSKASSREVTAPPRVTRSVPITDVVSEGDLVVVQISKEPIGTKGARVTSHVSLPGRYVVYLPTVDHLGVSKRIGSSRERSRLREVMDSLKPTRGGLIVRTVAEGLTKKQLKADVGYLIRVWAEVCKRRETAKPTEVLYTELDLVLKVARDLFTDEVKRIVIDDREQYARLVRFVEMFLPERVKDIELYSGSEPIFDAYGIEDEIGRALSRKVPLPSGGSLIVDQAEALTAIDVNTGRYVGKGSKDLEETAFKTNLEAVEEIAYQLRFRNIGGLVILDLIDMEKHSSREKVWRALEAALAKDKAKTTLNRISELGLIEMTRKRTRESLGRMLHEPCFYCDGTGQIQSKATIAYEILRQIGRERHSLPGYSVIVNAHPAIVDFLKTVDRGALEEAERKYTRRIDLVQRSEYHIEQYDLQGK